MFPCTQLTTLHQIFDELMLSFKMIFLGVIDTDDRLGTLGVNGLYIEGVQSTCDDLAWVIRIARCGYFEGALLCSLCLRMMMYRVHRLAGVRRTSAGPAQN